MSARDDYPLMHRSSSEPSAPCGKCPHAICIRKREMQQALNEIDRLRVTNVELNRELTDRYEQLDAQADVIRAAQDLVDALEVVYGAELDSDVCPAHEALYHVLFVISGRNPKRGD